MLYRNRKFAGPSLVAAGLTTALFTASDALAQERITLETIGAVRMTGSPRSAA